MDSFAIGQGEFGVTLRDLRRGTDGCIDSFVVEIKEPELSARVRVDHCEPFPGPEKFFQDLAQNWTGWRGEMTWRSSEAQLELAATCDSWGHVKVHFRVRPVVGADSWRASTVVPLEAGQLDLVARRATAFFRSEP